MRPWLISVAALFSGAAALSYEVVWSRALVVPLGSSTDATAMVLTGFMLGIAVGAYAGGRFAERVASPLRAYAALELGLGVYAAFAPLLLSVLSTAPSGLRHVMALVLIAAPGIAMGATLPLLARSTTHRETTLTRQIGVIYGANTLGAALGALATGFWGIAELGVWRSSMVAGAASLVAAAMGWLLSRALPAPAAGMRDGARATAVRRIALLGTFASGFAMLACELLWARVLTFVFGHDTYAFASLLALVLFGLAIGGFAQRLLSRIDQAKLLAVLLGLFAVAAMGSFWLAAAVMIRHGPDPFGLATSERLATTVWLELYREVAFTPLLVLLPSILAGAAFPAACAMYRGGHEDAGRTVGIVGLVNGVGSALGAAGAAFFLVSIAGIQAAFGLAAMVAATGAACVVVSSPRARRRRWAFAPLAGLVLLELVMPRQLPRAMLLKAVGERHQTLLHYEEARTATISVIENQVNGERQLLVNAVNEVTTRLVHDQSFKVLGHLGPLLHPDPRRAVMICLGAGVSAGAAATHPLTRLDVVDLSSAVSRGAELFEDLNNGVLRDPIFALHIEDGRQFLLNSPGGYDLAIVDSTHPKSVDSWLLYTQEFYRLVRDRLDGEGIMVQWLPLHGLSEREFKIVVRTFHSVFPGMTLWANAGYETYGQVGYAKLVGRRGGPITVDVGRMSERLSRPRVRADLEHWGMARPAEILDAFVAGPEAVAEWTRDLPVQTDDRPIVPFISRFSTGRRMTPPLLLALREPIDPLLRNVDEADEDALRSELALAYQAQGLVLAGQPERAAEMHPRGQKTGLYLERRSTTVPYYSALAAVYEDDADQLFVIGTQLGDLGHGDAARSVFLRALAIRPGDFRSRLNLALLDLAHGRLQRAIAELTRLNAERPSSLVDHNLGAAVLASGDPGTATIHLRRALRGDPNAIHTHLALAQAWLDQNDAHRADEQLRALIADNPWVAEAHDMLGLAAASRGEHAEAIPHHERARKLNPYRTATLFNLGLAHMHERAFDAATGVFRAALDVDPHHAMALNNLGLIEAERGHFPEAIDLYHRALEADPDNALAAHNIGLVHRRQNQPADAARAFCLALSIDPALVPSRQQLAELGRPASECN